jgi:hypothetical protein
VSKNNAKVAPIDPVVGDEPLVFVLAFIPNVTALAIDESKSAPPATFVAALDEVKPLSRTLERLEVVVSTSAK